MEDRSHTQSCRAAVVTSGGLGRGGEGLGDYSYPPKLLKLVPPISFQPRRVGLFSGGPADWFVRGAPYFFKCGKAGEQTRAGPDQQFSRGAQPPWAPRRYGAGLWLVLWLGLWLFHTIWLLVYLFRTGEVEVKCDVQLSVDDEVRRLTKVKMSSKLSAFQFLSVPDGKSIKAGFNHLCSVFSYLLTSRCLVNWLNITSTGQWYFYTPARGGE